MRKIYLNLTQDQKERGVIFSSALSYDRTDDGDLIHEVTDRGMDGRKEIERLLDDKFFNSSSWKYNIIRN